MRTLLINQAFVSPDEPGHTRHFELAQYLRGQGHELVIVGSDTNYQTGEKIIRHRGIAVDQHIEGVRIIRAKIPAALHHSYFARVLAFISFMVTSTLASLRVMDIDLVMATTPPIFQALSTWFVAAVRRKPFLLEVRDLWPEFGISMGVLKNPVVIWFSRRLEHFLYRMADSILANSPAYVDYLLSRSVPAQKITYIPYGTDIDMFRPDIDPGDWRQRWGLQDKFIALYAGALGQANDIFTIVRAAQHLQSNRDIHIVLVGDGKMRKPLEVEVERIGLANVHFAGVVPKRDMPSIIRSADVCLAILQDIPMFRTTFPNKVFDYMASGKATVLVIDGVIRQLIEESGGGVYVPPGDDRALADALQSVQQQPGRLEQMGVSAREFICDRMDRRLKMEETLQLMMELAGRCK